MPTSSRGPVTERERALAPDLARGVALLGIALANSVGYVTDRRLGPSYRPVDGSSGDRVVDLVVGVFVDNRAFPMFTLLFTYGLVLLARRQEAAGVTWPDSRRLLVRRCTWLTVFGVTHLVLLFTGDILTVYGLLGLGLVLLLLRASDRVLRLVGWVSIPAYAAFGALDGLSAGTVSEPTDGVDALLERLGVLSLYVVGAPLLVLVFLPPAVVGVLLARRRVLERPHENLPLLRRLTVVGLSVSVAGSLPLVATSVGWWDPVTWLVLAAAVLHTVTGLAGAIAFAAGVGWYAGTRHERDGPPTGVERALVAVGRRSLTCYLLQSVLFVPLLASWTGGLGVGAGTAFLAALAVGVYLVTVLVAVGLDRADRTGPAEWLLRRLTYGRPA